MTGDDKKSSDSEAPSSEIPEVDAEIVTEEETPGDEQTAGSLFEDEEKPASPKPEETAAPRRSLLSPGVLFFAGMVIVAIAAGLVWFFTAQPETQPSAGQNASAPAQTAPVEETAAPKIETSEPDKLANDAVDELKTTAQSPAPIDSADVQLPEPEDTIDNLALQDAAKEAGVSGDTELNNVSTDNAMQDKPAIMFETEGAPAEKESGAMDDAAPETEDDARETEPETAEAVDAVDAVDAVEIANAEDATPATFTGKAGANTETPNETDFEAAAEKEEIAALEADLTSARAQVSELRAVIASRDRDLETERTTLNDTRRDLADARAEISSLRNRNAVLKEAARNSPVAESAVALNSIMRALDTGEPFTAALAVIENSAAKDTDLAALKPYAAAGAPTLETIRARFNDAAREGLAVAGREQANGLWARFGARASSLVSVRPTKPQAGDSPRAIISRAEHAVETGALEKAIDELSALPKPAQEIMADWIGLARDRIAVEDATEALNKTLQARARG